MIRCIVIFILFFIIHGNILYSQQDTIQEPVQPVNLPQIYIGNSKKSLEKIGFLRKTRFFGRGILFSHEEIITVLIPAGNYEGNHFESVSIRFAKLYNKLDKRNLKLKNNEKAIVRLKIYHVRHDTVFTPVLTSGTFAVDFKKNDVIKWDLSSREIYFEKEGVAFGVEFLGFYDSVSKKIRKEKAFIRVLLTPGKSPYYEQLTFLKTSSGKLIEIKSLFSEFEDGKYADRNLSIAFTLSGK